VVPWPVSVPLVANARERADVPATVEPGPVSAPLVAWVTAPPTLAAEPTIEPIWPVSAPVVACVTAPVAVPKKTVSATAPAAWPCTAGGVMPLRRR